MSASNEWWEYHLTPDGWVVGNERLDGGYYTNRPTPPKTVYSVRYHQYYGSPHSRMKESWDEFFRSNDTELIEKLLTQYGKNPK